MDIVHPPLSPEPSAAAGGPSRRDLLAYAALALPLAFGGLPLYIHAPDFFATHHGLGLALLGFALAWLRLWDAVLDPLAGWVGDRWPARRGALIACGAVALASGVIGMFAPLPLPTLIWFAITMAVASAGHSLISVNLLALGGLWRRDPAQKATISAWREGLGLIGLMAAVVLPAALAPILGRQGGLLCMAFVLAVLLAGALMLFRRWRARIAIEQHARRAGRPNWRALAPFYGVAALVTLSAALPAVLILMLVRDLLGAEPLAGVFLLAYFAAAVPGALLAASAARRFGAVPVWGVALAGSVAGFAFALTLAPGDVLPFTLISIATGFCFGADLVLPPVILSARLDQLENEHAASRAFGALGLITKLALALAGALALPALEAAGFRPGAPNPPEILQILLLLYAGLPLLLRLLAIAALFQFHRTARI